MHLTPMTKPLLSAMEAAEVLFYKYVFEKYMEHRKGRMRVLFRTTGPKPRRKHLGEQFARNLIRYKERLIKTKDCPEKQEDIKDATKDTTYMQKDAGLRQAWEKANAGLVSKKTRKQEILDI